MKAKRLICPAFHQLEWQSFDIPQDPGPREVVIRSACSLISVGTEIAVYNGSHIAYSIPDAVWPRLPVEMGYCLAGTVEVVGSQVQELVPGDRVMARATHGDWAVCNLDTTIVRVVPDGLSMQDATLASMSAISLLGVRQAQIALGEVVVVIGLGLVGQMATQLSRLSGAYPLVGLDLIPSRLQLAVASAHHTFNPGQENVIQVLKELTRGRMAEVVIEATGSPKVVQFALDLASEGGRVVLLGSQRGKIEIDAYSTIHRKGISLIGANERLASPSYSFRDPWTRQRNLDLVLRLLANGSLNSDHLISHYIAPGEVQTMYEMLSERPNDFMGVVIDWGVGGK